MCMYIYLSKDDIGQGIFEGILVWVDAQETWVVVVVQEIGQHWDVMVILFILQFVRC